MKDLSSHIMDIVQNSIRAEARKIEILVNENPEADDFTIDIRDNGKGMDADTLKRAGDPFFTSRTVRKVGLGIPLLQQNAERTGGWVKISSTPDKGTDIYACFSHSHLDRPPLGDIAKTLSLLAAANPDIHFIYIHATPQGRYKFDTREIEETLEGIPLSHPDIVSAIQEMIRENLQDIEADQVNLNITNEDK